MTLIVSFQIIRLLIFYETFLHLKNVWPLDYVFFKKSRGLKMSESNYYDKLILIMYQCLELLISGMIIEQPVN